jgi:glycerophosphoryl diester phosphodiesterase
MVDKIYYSSFDHEQLMRMKRVYPDAKVAPLYSFNMPLAWEYAKTLGVWAMHPKYTQLDLYPEYIDRCHEAGIWVNPWTADDPELCKKLADMGIDAFITNVPDVVRGVLGLED